MEYPLKGELRLPTGPSEALQIAVPILERWWSRDQMQLGGGTALAARWQHRHSTDVDLFIDSIAYRRIHTEHSEFIEDVLNEYEKRGVLQAFDVNRGFLDFVTKHGAVSLMTIPRVLTPTSQENPDWDRHTKVPFESTAEILAKKLAGRIWGKGVFNERDAYDIAVAGIYEPEALEIARKSLSRSELESISQEYRSLSRTGWEPVERIREAVFPTIESRLMLFAHQAIEGQYLDKTDVERVQVSEHTPDRDRDSDELEL